jgi:hypothetical protein
MRLRLNSAIAALVVRKLAREVVRVEMLSAKALNALLKWAMLLRLKQLMTALSN